MSWEQEYCEMVNELMHKDGEPSPLWVLALGLCGEAAEVSVASNTAYDDDFQASHAVLPELGDVLWYVTAITIRLGMRQGRAHATALDMTMYEAAGLIADVVKKDAWHGKPLDPTKVGAYLETIISAIRGHARCYGLTLEGIARLNMKKLRARYPGGVFAEGGGVR